MKKLLVGILSVAGLLAVMLSASGSPAISQAPTTYPVEIRSDQHRGVYTVTWQARGGCNNARNGNETYTNTSGNAELIASPRVFTACTYSWTATYSVGTNVQNSDSVALPRGTECKATVDITQLGSDPSRVSVEVDVDDCKVEQEVTITITGPASSSAAIATKTWEVTASSTGNGADGNKNTAAPECDAKDKLKKSATSKSAVVNNANVQQATIELLTEGFNKSDDTATSCEYDFVVKLQPGFEAEVRDSDKRKAWDFGEGATFTLSIKVSSREIYVVQNVKGDAGSAVVQYFSSLTCADPDAPDLSLPGRISSAGGQSGIRTVDTKVLVSLLPGRYDVTEGLALALSSGSLEGRKVPVAATNIPGDDVSRVAIVGGAVNAEGLSCVLEVRIEGIPSICNVPQATQNVALSTARPRNIVEFNFTCNGGGSSSDLPATSESAAGDTAAGDTSAEDDTAGGDTSAGAESGENGSPGSEAEGGDGDAQECVGQDCLLEEDPGAAEDTPGPDVDAVTG